jgi:hypothetical protein
MSLPIGYHRDLADLRRFMHSLADKTLVMSGGTRSST